MEGLDDLRAFSNLSNAMIQMKQEYKLPSITDCEGWNLKHYHMFQTFSLAGGKQEDSAR